MRKIDILNKSYEKIGLDTIVYTNKTIDEVVYIDSDGKEWKLSDLFSSHKLLTGDIIGITDGTNIQRIQIPLSTFNNLKTYPAGSIDNNFIVPGFPNEIASNILTNGNPGDYESGSVDLFLGVDLGTYATLIDAQNGLQGLDISYLVNNTFETDPSAEKIAEWFEIFHVRKNITKETYTLREFIELNVVTNPTFDNPSNVGIAEAW